MIQRPDREQLEAMFDWGTADVPIDDETLSCCVTDLLDAPLSALPGLGYDGPGTLRACLADESPPIAILERLKDWSNVQRMGGDNAMPAPLAKYLYFLTLAVALDRTGTKITGIHDNALHAGFEWTQQQAWRETEFEPLVARALSSVIPNG